MKNMATLIRTRVEVHTNIRLFHANKLNPTQIHKEIFSEYGQKAKSKNTVLI